MSKVRIAFTLLPVLSLAVLGCSDDESANTSGAGAAGSGASGPTGPGSTGPGSTGSGAAGTGSGGGSAATTGAGGQAGGAPASQVVFIILLENHDWSDIEGSSSAPYINGTLLPMSSYAEQYYNPPDLHPSEPNYIWLEAGDNLGIDNDDNPDGNHQSTTDHLVTYLEAAGLSWKSYQEDIPGTDCPLDDVNDYAPKHNPMVFFDDVTENTNPSSANCIAKVRPYTELAGDLAGGNVANYSFITPNLCNDMHDSCGPIDDQVRQGDTWLSVQLPMLMGSQAYADGATIFITFDEGEGSDGPIGMIVVGNKAKGGGYTSSIHYTHSSTLRTIQEMFGVMPLLRDAANATDLSDLFATFP